MNWYRAKVHSYLEDGEHITAFRVYIGTYKATVKSMHATFAHPYKVKEKKLLAKHSMSTHA